MTKVFCLFIIGCMIIACTPQDARDIDSRSDTNHLGGTISTDKIMLNKNSVFSIKPELFQPSFGLGGIIQPHLQEHITTPEDAIISQILTQPNVLIQKNDPVLVLTPITQYSTQYSDKNPLATNNHQALNQDNNNQISCPMIESPITLKSPITGKISISPTTKNNQITKKGEIMATVYDDSRFEFVSILPRSYEPYLKIGMVVNFVTKSQNQSDISYQSFTGQVANIATTTSNRISVLIQILPNQDQNLTLKQGMSAFGHIDYGQMEIGALVPRQAIISDELNTLDTPPYKPSKPMTAKIWVIKQNGTLSLTDIEVIKYQPDTQRYLVYGLKQDSLITSAMLPAQAHGMPVGIK